MDYIRWLFKLDFCTPRYIIYRELLTEKLKVGWGIRAMRFEEKVIRMEDSLLLKQCWNEKRKGEWSDRYGSEREKYYNRVGWSVRAIDMLRNEGRDIESEILGRERDLQRQWEDGKIQDAQYNKIYKRLDRGIEGSTYLKNERLDTMVMSPGDEIRALVKLQCGNFEEQNKYWMERGEVKCLFLCENKQDCMRHYVYECEKATEIFATLGTDVEER